MPFRKTTVRRRHTRGVSGSLSWEQVEQLMTGFCFIAQLDRTEPLFESEDHRRKAWSQNRRQLLAWWFDGLPKGQRIPPGVLGNFVPNLFCRPRAWWDFDAPERRRITRVSDPADPLGPMYDARPSDVARIWENAEESARALERDCAAFYGRPGATTGAGAFEVESEQAYLTRLDLLTTAEKLAGGHVIHHDPA